ncbi:MAG: hypothetical protein JWM93_3320 [Frankiales bacterium]|nr:hypothetical protein [Frankiales bacterium]
MPAVRFPSDPFPSWPSIALDVPGSWQPVAVAGVLLAARELRSEGFAPNVVITAVRHTIAYEPSAAVADVDAEIAKLADATMLDPIDVTIEGVPCHSRAIAYRDATAGTLAQLHVIASVANGPFLDVIHVVASCAGNAVDTDFHILQEVVSSMRISLSAAE